MNPVRSLARAMGASPRDLGGATLCGMKTVKEMPDISGKKVILRVDFDVPVSDGKIQEPFRIEKQGEMLDWLRDKGAKTLMVAHVSDADDFSGLMEQISQMLGRPVELAKKIEDIELAFSKNDVVLLDNIRQYEGEKNNSEELAKKLANGFDYYINNAFAVSHRAHMSVSALAKVLPAYGGLQLEREVENLSKALLAPAQGKVIIMGGAKASTKIPVIKNLIANADAVLVGGVIANDILKFRGDDVGQSKVDEDLAGILAGLDLKNERLRVPVDFNVSQEKILDIGPLTIRQFEDIIRQATTIIWNGPMGLFEDERFSNGTNAITRSVMDADATTIVGGGDTISAISRFDALDKFSFVSTGGGAMLSFLAGDKMPGLEAVK